MNNNDSARRDDNTPSSNVPAEPLTLDYRSPQPGAPERPLKFWHGLLAGFLLSAFWWFSGVNRYFHMSVGLGAFGGMIVLAAIKLVGSVVALCFYKWRAFGAGVLTSVGLVFLIFAGICGVILMH